MPVPLYYTVCCEGSVILYRVSCRFRYIIPCVGPVPLYYTVCRAGSVILYCVSCRFRHIILCVLPVPCTLRGVRAVLWFLVMAFHCCCHFCAMGSEVYFGLWFSCASKLQHMCCVSVFRECVCVFVSVGGVCVCARVCVCVHI